MVFNMKKIFGKDNSSDDYVPLDVNPEMDKKEKIKIRPFTLKKFDDVTEILDSIREGYSIALIDIKPIRTKDIIELKRSISKIKKTVDALEGSIAGFGENIIIVAPKFAEVFKSPERKEKKEEVSFY